jgi:hypothetical protein
MKVHVFTHGWLTHLVQITADPKTPPGYAVRADLLDIIEIFEVNRKECARLLVEYPKWAVIGTFKPRPGDLTEASDRKPLLGRDWQLESTLIEVLFSFSCAYPTYHLCSSAFRQTRLFLARSSFFLKVPSNQYITLH